MGFQLGRQLSDGQVGRNAHTLAHMRQSTAQPGRSGESGATRLQI
jgi:hypothetical protein